jgi:hypothetical protein
MVIVKRTGFATVNADGSIDCIIRATQGRVTKHSSVENDAIGEALKRWQRGEQIKTPAVPGSTYAVVFWGNFIRGMGISDARKVSAAKEAARLRKSGEGSTRARTRAPGIKGFIHRERMSQSAGENRRWESLQLAEWLESKITAGFSGCIC